MVGVEIDDRAISAVGGESRDHRGTDTPCTTGDEEASRREQSRFRGITLHGHQPDLLRAKLYGMRTDYRNTNVIVRIVVKCSEYIPSLHRAHGHRGPGEEVTNERR
jgi:hypothetical protein